MTHKPLTLEETIEAARMGADIDDVVRETSAMTDDEIARSLEADGVDLGLLDARLRAMGRELFPESADKPRHTKRNLALTFGGGFATAAATLAALVESGAVQLATGTAAPTVSTAAPSPSAADIRKEAFELCGRGRWKECLARFDDAKAIDPPGDADPEVASARARAKASLEPR